MELIKQEDVNEATHIVVSVSIAKDTDEKSMREMVEAMKGVNRGTEDSFYYCTEGKTWLGTPVFTWHFAYPRDKLVEYRDKLHDTLAGFGFKSGFGTENISAIACPCK